MDFSDNVGNEFKWSAVNRVSSLAESDCNGCDFNRNYFVFGELLWNSISITFYEWE